MTASVSSVGGEDRQAWPVDGLRAHAGGDIVPAISGEEYALFRADVAARGVLVALSVTAEGIVLDGRARLQAACELNVASVPVCVVDPDDEVEFILLAALRHRHLSASQRAALAVELDSYRAAQQRADARRRANLKQEPGSEVATLPPRGKTRELAAAIANVSPRTAQDAATVHKRDPELFQQVKAGLIPADRAARRIRQRERDAALPAAPPLPEGPFEIVLADPPWRFHGSADSSRAAENHYPTMPLDAIAALNVPSAEDAALFLWVPNSLLPHGLEVMSAWGFTYATNFAWVKDKIGLGSWNRTQHELLLVGHRGTFKAPTENRRASSVIHAPRRRHSAKPAAVHELLERAFPRASKVELFAREPRTGWVTWGNEVTDA